VSPATLRIHECHSSYPRTPVTLSCQQCSSEIPPGAVSFRPSGGGRCLVGEQNGRTVTWIAFHVCAACAGDGYVRSKPRPCSACGRPVVASRYCSRSCEAFVYRRRARMARRSIACRHCQRLFTPSRRDARYCSGACRQAAYRERAAVRLEVVA